MTKPKTQLLHIVVPMEILRELDKQAEITYQNRSRIIRQALTAWLRRSDPASVPQLNQASFLMTDAELKDLQHAIQVELGRRGGQITARALARPEEG